MRGAAYLLYIGWQIFNAPPASVGQDDEKSSLGHIFRQTIFMNILNPKVALFFLAFLPQFVDTASPYVTEQFIIFGVLFQIVALFIMGSVGLFSGAITARLGSGQGQNRGLGRVAGSAVMSLGAFIPIRDVWNHLAQS